VWNVTLSDAVALRGSGEPFGPAGCTAAPVVAWAFAPIVVLFALSIAAFQEDLPRDTMAAIFEAASDKVREAGGTLAGGHTIRDPEPKYGMAVTGLVDPARIVRNSTMLAGDGLVLTKPLGLGIIATAVKNGRASTDQQRAAVEVMTTLNRAAAEAMVEVGVSAATDVTGFGLLGHLHIALRESRVSAVLNVERVSYLDGTEELARAGMIPSGTRSNHEFVSPHVDWGTLDEIEQLMLADAQTSGGLLIAVPEPRADRLAEALTGRRVPCWVIGRVERGAPGTITLA